jgi:N-acetylmuramoyl-L-alanine amidase
VTASANGLPLVSGVRFGLHGDRTRIVLQLDAPVDFATTALPDPPRLIIDLPEVRWRVQSGRLARPRGLVTGQRYGKYAPGHSRLILDLARPFAIADQFTLPATGGDPSFRVVVDVAPASGMAAAQGPTSPPPGTSPGSAATDGSSTVAAAGTPVGVAMVGPPPPKPERRKLVIVLDPGHGGIDPGGVGVHGIEEKTITLPMALEVKRLLEAEGRYKVILTRDDDTYVTLRDRVMVAHDAGADLFVSIHTDMNSDRAQRGASVYTLSEKASDKEAARLAASENKVDILTGADLSNQDPVVTSILIDLAQRDTSNHSITLADELVDELGSVTRLVRHTRRFAGFVVLKSPDTPSVLIELGYLSNPQDARRLTQPGYRATLAGAIVRGIDQYFAAAR